MHLDCVCDPQLPKLAWLAVLEKEVPAIRLIHGDWVETGEQFAFEGAWGRTFPQSALIVVKRWSVPGLSSEIIELFFVLPLIHWLGFTCCDKGIPCLSPTRLFFA